MPGNTEVFSRKANQEAFVSQHPTFMLNFDSLRDLVNKVFCREVQFGGPPDRVIYYTGRTCAEEFGEILFLCGNGYGIAAMKLLRGMYERAVTAQYIANFPAEAKKFLDYFHVHNWRRLNHAKQLFGGQIPKMTEGAEENLRHSYEDVKEQFEEVLCEKCDSSRTSPSWAMLDVASMASKASKDLKDLYLPCFFEPTMQLHSTFAALAARTEVKDGEEKFLSDYQPKDASAALMLATGLILIVLETQINHFSLPLKDEHEQLCKGLEPLLHGEELLQV